MGPEDKTGGERFGLFNRAPCEPTSHNNFSDWVRLWFLVEATLTTSRRTTAGDIYWIVGAERLGGSLEAAT